MNPSSLRALIDDVASGECTPDDAVRQLRRLPYADLGFARIDHHRDLRQGMPEAIYGPGKAPEHCAAIVEELLTATTAPVLLTRATDAQVKAVAALTEALGHGTGEVTQTGSTSTVTFRPAPACGDGRGRDGGDGGSPGGARMHGGAARRSASPRPSWSTAGWRACTVCWPRSTAWQWPMQWW